MYFKKSQLHKGVVGEGVLYRMVDETGGGSESTVRTIDGSTVVIVVIVWWC